MNEQDPSTVRVIGGAMDVHRLPELGLLIRIHDKQVVWIVFGLGIPPVPRQIRLTIRGESDQVALFHELVHAYYEAQGKNLSNEDSVDEWNGRYYELAAVGLPPFDNEPYSENKLRDELVVARRIRY